MKYHVLEFLCVRVHILNSVHILDIWYRTLILLALKSSIRRKLHYCSELSLNATLLKLSSVISCDIQTFCQAFFHWNCHNLPEPVVGLSRPGIEHRAYVKDISWKQYILWEKELIEARRAENNSFSHRMFSAYILLKTLFSLC